MKRKDFLKVAGGAMLSTAILSFGGQKVFAGSSPVENVSSDKIKKMIEAEVKRVFNSSLDPTLVQSRWRFAESYEVVMNENKTTAFDCADEIIALCKEYDFDATSLREGTIPNNFKAYKNKISIKSSGKRVVLPVNGLKNYDAKLVYMDCYTLNTDLAPKDWKSIIKVKEVGETVSPYGFSTTRYESIVKGESIRIWKTNISEDFIVVKTLKPSISINSFKEAIDSKRFFGVLNEEVIKTLK